MDLRKFMGSCRRASKSLASGSVGHDRKVRAHTVHRYNNFGELLGWLVHQLALLRVLDVKIRQTRCSTGNGSMKPNIPFSVYELSGSCYEDLVHAYRNTTPW